MRHASPPKESWQKQDATLKRLTVEYELLGDWQRSMAGILFTLHGKGDINGYIILLVGGLEHQFYFPIYWVSNHPN